MSSIRLPEEIERFRERLLDLSLRNPLLNYRKSKRRTLQVVNELPNVIYERLVDAGKSFVLDYVPDPPKKKETAKRDKAPIDELIEAQQLAIEFLRDSASQKSQEEGPLKYDINLPEEPDDPDGVNKNLFDNKLQTNLTQAKLNATVRYMQSEARTAVQETGINYLFLAVGFLAWQETEGSTGERMAPLILVPVTIEKGSRTTGEPVFSVQWDEDDVQFNICLQKKLARDFDLRFPDFDPSSTPEDYFEAVSRAVRSKPDWEIRREAVLGFFSFHKLSMYADIDPALWDFDEDDSSGTIVERLIAGSEEEIDESRQATLYASDYNVDYHDIAQQILVPMDADSSQLSALVDIRKGKNLVIEGPPGTGKSQTISNAIADALRDGKTILFVAEKLAALQVVHDRLVAQELGDFCLELHSDASSPRKVFESLAQRLSREYTSPEDLHVKRSSLGDRRQLLNEYVAKMAERVGPNNVAIYDLLWRIVALRGSGAKFVRDAVRQLPKSRSEFENALRELKSFGQVLAETESPRSSLWWGFFPRSFAFRQEEEIRQTLAGIKESAYALRTTAEKLSGEWGLSSPEVVAVSLQLDSACLRDVVEQTPVDCADLAPILVDDDLLQDSRQFVNRVVLRNSVMASLVDELGDQADYFIQERAPIQALLNVVKWRGEAQVAEIMETLNWLIELQNVVETADEMRLPFREYSLTQRRFDEELDRCIKISQLLRHPIVDDPSTVTRAMFDGSVRSTWRSTSAIHQDLRDRRQRWVRELDISIGGSTCNIDAAVSYRHDLIETVSEFKGFLSLDSTVEDVESITSWAERGDVTIKRIKEIAEKCDGERVPNVTSPSEFSTVSVLVRLARHSAVNDRNCLNEFMFRREGKKRILRATEESEKLQERRALLESSFHIPSIPDSAKITSIAKMLRRHRRGWFKSLNPEYREARQQLDEFTAVGKKQSVDAWIRALEDLEAVEKDEQRFRETSDYSEAFGESFKGSGTDWDTLKTRFDWAATARQHGLNYQSATDLLKHRDKLLPGVTSAELKDLDDAVVDLFVRSEYHRLFLFLDDIKNVEFEAISFRLHKITTLGRRFREIAKAIELPTDWTLRTVEALVRAAGQIAQINSEVDEFANNEDLKASLGRLFCGLDTDWSELEKALNWTYTIQKAGVDFETTQSLFKARDSLLASFDSKKAATSSEKLKRILSERPRALAGEIELCDEELGHALKAKLKDVAQVVDAGLEKLTAVSISDSRPVSSIQELIQFAHQLNEHTQEIDTFAAKNRDNLSAILDRADRDPKQLQTSIDWFTRLKEVLATLPSDVGRSMMQSADRSSLDAVYQELTIPHVCKDRLTDLYQSLENFATVIEDWIPVDTASILTGTTESKSANLIEHLSELPAWSNFTRALSACEDLGVVGFCTQAIDGMIDASLLASSYELTVHEIVAEDAFNESDLLRGASGQKLHELRREFQSLDRELRDLIRQEIAAKAADRIPPIGNGKGRVGEYTDLSLIRHETQKQKRHCRIRDLMKRAGTAVQALKPCFMMSPLSVSRFIPKGTVEFDLVIMDEASQIKPEDSVGTILRAKQLVVVGDPKQLPPTSFFDRLDEEIDENDATQLDNTESILEAAMKVFQPFRRLRWHYRSRHESLIHFSNTRFYDDDLIVFPSPSDGQGDFGIRHVYVEDANFASGANLKEAQAVVEEIIRHAMTRPESSLGIGTFNKKQAELIEELLDKRCDSDPAASLAVDRLRHLEEELFIKNLENLQGDERDVIFVCYTYGRDAASGKLMQRFGPINTEKGWRRLNVLITRSRESMTVISSIKPSEIQGGPDKSRGVNAYKDFLSYAMTGTLEDTGAITARPPDSPFEIAVCREINAMGLEAVPQVGVAGFFIDIGVRRREGDRSFILGVECDGATYHSAKCARDRDRLREEIVRSRGWEIHRIWSTDWFLNQEAETQKLKAAIELAMRD